MEDKQLPEETKEENKRLPILANGRGLALRSMDDMWRFACAVRDSGLAPKGIEKPEQILIAIQSGAELGIPPMRSLQSFCVINGAARLYGDTPLALVKQSGKLEYIKEWIEGEKEDMIAYCEVKRKEEPEPVKRWFSVEDAQTAGLWKKPGPWQNYPKRMLQMRARSLALRDVFPDCFGGVTIAEEWEGIDTPEPSHETTTPRRDERKQVDSETIEENPIIKNAIKETFSRFINKTGQEDEDVVKFCEFCAEAIGCDVETLWIYDEDVLPSVNVNSFDLERLAAVNKAIDAPESPKPENKTQTTNEDEKTDSGEGKLPKYVCKRCGNTYQRKPKNMKCKCLGEVVENE